MPSNTTPALSLSDDHGHEHLALNSIASLVIDGITGKRKSKSPPISLSRVQPPLLDYTPFWPKHTKRYTPLTVADSWIKGGPPPRLPSALPALGNVHLSLTVSSLLGAAYDRSTQVFSTAVVEDPENPGLASRLPPLAIKVAPSNRIAILLREASLYEEMESIQGIAIPRCFGIFAGRLPDGFSLPKAKDRPLTDSDSDSDSDESSHTDMGSINAIDSESDSDDDHPLRGYPEVREYVCLSNYDSNEVYVLLMEEMGKKVFPSETTIPTDILIQDLREVTEDLAFLYIEHCDWEYTNVREPGAPEWRRFCSRHKCMHRTRLLDFSHAHKRDLKPERIIDTSVENWRP